MVSPVCQEEDSFERLLRRTGPAIPFGGDEVMSLFLPELARRATVRSPGYPEPIRDVRMGEFEIELPPSPVRSEGEISFEL